MLEAKRSRDLNLQEDSHDPSFLFWNVWEYGWSLSLELRLILSCGDIAILCSKLDRFTRPSEPKQANNPKDPLKFHAQQWGALKIVGIEHPIFEGPPPYAARYDLLGRAQPPCVTTAVRMPGASSWWDQMIFVDQLQLGLSQNGGPPNWMVVDSFFH